MPLRKRKEVLNTTETWLETARIVAAMTTGVQAGGLRLSRKRLDEPEQLELIQLVVGKAADRRGFDIHRLNGRERSRYESLVEQAAGRPPGSVFEALRSAREAAELEREIEPIRRQLRAPNRRVDLHQVGSVTVDQLWCFGWLDRADPVLFISQLGLLVFLAAQLENGACLCPQGATEGEGDDLALLIDRRLGLGAKFNDEESRVSWRRDLDHLVANEFFEVEKAGHFLRVRRGERLRNATRRAA